MAVGRITGPLLKANLLRHGVDLAFETNLLYLDVTNGKVGIKTVPDPQYDLDVNGKVKSTNLDVTTQADIATFTISGNTIASSDGTINLEPSGTNAVVYQGKIVTGDLQVSANTIEVTAADTDLEISTLGTGKVNVNADMQVNGDLHVTGNLQVDGDANGTITIGDTTTDNVEFKADVNSHIIPDDTDTWDLGSDPTFEYSPGVFGKEWRKGYFKDVIADNVTSSNLVINGIDLVLPQGNIIYVAENGNDANSGLHEHAPFRTVKHALSQADPDFTVFVYPGTYTEIFPLTIPKSITLKGAGIRSVTIQPTVGTVDNDAFLIDGETTVEDLTLTGFRYNGTNNTGYGFRLANNFKVTTRSPYIRNVSVITRGSTVSAGDPYGFDSNDAGKGALFDGSIANATSKEVSILFSNATFITPNQEAISATNGIRIEWLNSFTYFADKGFYLTSGSTGFAGAGLTRLRIDNRTGTWAVGNTVSYYDTDGTTVLGTGTIASIDGNYVNLTGKCTGFETITDRVPTTLYAQGDAKLSTAEKKFGTASLALDGVGDYVTHPSTPDFAFGSNDFTLEAWVYRTSSNSTNQIIFDFRTVTSQTVPTLFLNTSYVPTYTVNGTSQIIGSVVVALNTWTHIAVARTGTSTRLFVNGAQTGSTYTDTNNYIQGPLTIGARFNGITPFVGYIDDVKISKGVARYTTTFTAPTTALTGDLSTVLLLNLNGANNSTTFLDNGVHLQDLRTSAGGTASIINFADYSDFGVEVRSIGSANVYGNYGIYGTGDGVIAYLISQNFAYVGSGKISTNDPNDRIAANEVVELSRAKIYITSVDNDGNFSIGDAFFVNQKTGEVLFNSQSLTINVPSGVVFTDGVDTTTITPTDITTGNIRISGNTIESLTGDVNVVAASGAINLKNNTFITGNLEVTGDITLGGNIQIGDAGTDTINFVGGISSNLIPATDSTYNLGQGGLTPLRWANAYLSRTEIDGLVIDSNTIQTTVGNDDLTLIAAGTGEILVPNNDVQINQALTVNGSTTLKGTSVTGDITQTGNVTQTGDYTQTGNTEITGNLTVDSYAQFEKIKIDLNTISTTATDTDLILEAAGTGKISIPTDDVTLGQDLTVDGATTLDNATVTNNLTVGSLSTGDILIENNSITTTVTNSNLELTANGTGIIAIPTNNVEIDQSLTVTQDLTVTTGTTYLKDTSVTGDITQTGNINQTGDFTTSGTVEVTGNATATGSLTVADITISGHTIESTAVDTDLALLPSGTGDIIFENIRVTDSTFKSTLTNQDIILEPNGVGSVLIQSNQSLIIPVGTDAQRPASPVNGMIRYNTDQNRYEGYYSNSNKWLRLSGVTDQDGNTYITAELTPGANDNIIRFVVNNSLLAYVDATKFFAERFETDDIAIYNDQITTVVTNTDINLTTPGTGGVRIGNVRIRNNTITNTVTNAVTEFGQSGSGYVKITGTNGVVIPIGDLTNLPASPEVGMIRFNTFYSYVEVWNGIQWVNSAGASSGVTLAQATDIGIVSALLFG